MKSYFGFVPLLPPASTFPVLSERSHPGYDELISNLLMAKVKKTPILNQLRKYRKARGLKQREAARILGFADASSLSRWEHGASLPSVMNMFRLAALYGTLVDALYIDALRTIRDEVRRREIEVLVSRIMPDNQPQERASSAMKAKSARIGDIYRKMLQTPDLSDQEIDDMRKHVIQLAQTLCEHVWGKRFY